MPLTVQQLNADTTFLLTFHTPPTTDASSSTDFTVLIDPWLTGPSPIFHSSFAVSRHTTKSFIQSLAELSKPPDIAIISQPKNDHCNKETLCTLPKSWPGIIAAVPAAAKKIRSWKYFEEEQIQIIPSYNPKNIAKVVHVPLDPKADERRLGTITLAYVPEPYDLSAVHNAIGITFRPTESASPEPLSILYTPHGLSPSLLNPYITKHLQPMSAHPIDLLFHSLNTEANPTLLGGVVSNGAPGGVEIAKMMRPKVWIGAHDEEKENGGVATKLIRCRVYGVEEVEGMLVKDGVEGIGVRRLVVGEVLRIKERGREGPGGSPGDEGCGRDGEADFGGRAEVG